MTVIKYWNRLWREAREAPSLKIFKTQLKKTWSKLLKLQSWPYFAQGSWTRDLQRSLLYFAITSLIADLTLSALWDVYTRWSKWLLTYCILNYVTVTTAQMKQISLEKEWCFLFQRPLLLESRMHPTAVYRSYQSDQLSVQPSQNIRSLLRLSSVHSQSCHQHSSCFLVKRSFYMLELSLCICPTTGLAKG